MTCEWLPSSDEVRSYKSVEAWYNRARSVRDGRPLGSGDRAIRLFVNGPIQFKNWKGTTAAELMPNDTLHIHHNVLGGYSTIRYSRWFSIAFRKIKGERYVVNLRTGDRTPFIGPVILDLKTHKFMNPYPEIVKEKVATPDQNKEWLRILKNFRRKATVMAKLGALKGNHDPYANSSFRELRSQLGVNTDEAAAKAVHKALVDNDPKAMMLLFTCLDATWYELNTLAGGGSWANKQPIPKELVNWCMRPYESRRDAVRELQGIITLNRGECK